MIVHVHNQSAFWVSQEGILRLGSHAGNQENKDIFFLLHLDIYIYIIAYIYIL